MKKKTNIGFLEQKAAVIDPRGEVFFWKPSKNVFFFEII